MSLHDHVQRYPALPLIVTVGLFLVAYPLLPNGVWGDALGAALVTLLVLAGVVSLRGGTARALIASALGTVGIGTHLGLSLVEHKPEATTAELSAAAASAPFFAFVAWHSLRYAVRHAKLTDDRLLAAASAYLLLGLAWSGVHALLCVLDPSAYSSPEGGPIDWGAFVYFSYVTLTTLGYGDLTPRSEGAQAAATIEAIVGVFFLGFLVARMLALPQHNDVVIAQATATPSEVLS